MFWVKLYDKVQNSELCVKIMLGSPVALGCSVSSGSHTYCSSMPANIKFCQSETDNPLKMMCSGLWCHLPWYICADVSLAPTIMDRVGSLGGQYIQTCLHYIIREVWTSKFTGNLLNKEFPNFLLIKTFIFILEPSVMTPHNLAVHYQPLGLSHDLFIHLFFPLFGIHYLKPKAV